jgi:uncharacterized membrane-anchored protein
MQLKNVPLITGRYWGAILAASMCGANTGDFLARILHLGHSRGLLPLALLFSLILWAESRTKTATIAYYWLAIIVVRTAATNLADLGAHDFRLPYEVFEAGLLALLIVFLLLDRARGPAAVSGGSLFNWGRQVLPSTNALYWAAMLTAGTLGTALGDYVADVVGLGLGYGSLVLATIYAVVLIVSETVGGMTKPWYWASIVAARTAGTTMGDFLASRRGLDLGLPLSTAVTACLLAGVVIFWREKGPQPEFLRQR